MQYNFNDYLVIMKLLLDILVHTLQKVQNISRKRLNLPDVGYLCKFWTGDDIKILHCLQVSSLLVCNSDDGSTYSNYCLLRRISRAREMSEPVPISDSRLVRY